MKAILILAGPYSSCLATKNIWQDVCLKYNVDFELYDLTDDTGKEIAKKIGTKSYPALIVNNKVVAVGHPSEESAEKVIHGLDK